jgi:putative methylase
MQKRITRKLDLEMLLSKIPPHPSPNAYLEQYVTPPDIAANMLHIAACNYDSIIGKRVLDLGCGTGRLAIGAAFLCAKETVGIDLDTEVVRKAAENTKAANVRGKVQWIAADIEALHGRFDTIVENPPFGVQKRGADTKFLGKAIELGKMIFSLHKATDKDSTLADRLKRGEIIEHASSNPFLSSFIAKRSAKILGIYAMLMEIPHMFEFHTRKKHEFVVDLYVISTEIEDQTLTTGFETSSRNQKVY